MVCEKCGANIAPGQQQCPNCGRMVGEMPITKEVNPIIHIVLGILIIGVVVGVVMIYATTKVSYREQQLTEKEFAKIPSKVEVTSPYTETVNIEVNSEIVQSSVYAQQDEEQEAESEDDSEYIFADSNERYLEKDEIYDLTQEEMRIARNEIYARLGRTFSDESLQEYFESKSWYEPLYTTEEFDAFGDHIFNEYEFYNKNLIAEIEKELGYK